MRGASAVSVHTKWSVEQTNLSGAHPWKPSCGGLLGLLGLLVCVPYKLTSELRAHVASESAIVNVVTLK